MSALIKGGRIITAADDYVGDVYVEGERIALIGESLDVDADRVIDASGKYVLPGCVDPHTHLDMPFGGTVTIDDVTSGQTAAAFGGTTCHVDFCIQPPGRARSPTRSTTWHAKREGKQVIDMGYHMAVTDLREGGSLEELARLPEQGDHVVQALHGLQGRAHGRRRDALPDDGGRGRDRRARDGARRERRRDRRARQAGARRRQHGAALPRADASARRPRARRRTARSSSHGSPARRCTSSTSRARRRSIRSRARASRAGTSGARRARSTSSSTTRTSSGPTSRARSTSTRRRRARSREPGGALARGALGHPLGDLDRPLRVPLGRAEDARHATTSRRSRTAGRVSRTGCT